MRVNQLQEHVASQESDSQTRLERVSAMLFEMSGESATAKAERECAIEVNFVCVQA